ncbi:MAG: ADP-heptose--LPS heptosyltransferase [Candidatus Tectimicrobiota bacterium]
MDSPLAVPDQPDWMACMRRGAFEEAWRISDAVLRTRAGVPCWHWPRHIQYVWDGSPLAGKRVLVRCYHGLGDTIQFLRYAPLIKAMAREVIVWAQPALLPLLRTMRGIDRLVPLHNGTPAVAYDVDVESMELPYIFRTTLATIPAEIPYLYATPAALRRCRRLAVGIVWAAGEWEHERRSLPYHCLAPLAALPDVTLYILQRGPALAQHGAAFGVLAGSESIGATARTMRALDLVVSVDSMPAHLAGALGVRVWTLLDAAADWRWLHGREDSPWYPTMRLFRQEQPGAWGPVMARVIAALQGL